jgi:hypothetical protein
LSLRLSARVRAAAATAAAGVARAVRVAWTRAVRGRVARDWGAIGMEERRGPPPLGAGVTGGFWVRTVVFVRGRGRPLMVTGWFVVAQWLFWSPGFACREEIERGGWRLFRSATLGRIELGEGVSFVQEEQSA